MLDYVRSTSLTIGAADRQPHAPGGRAIPRKPRLRSPRQRILLSIVAEYGQPISTTDLAQITEESLGATAHHVRAMVKAGLLDWAGERRARGALQTFYVISEEGRAALREPRIDALLTLFGAFVTRRDGQLKLVTRLDHQAADELHAVIARLKPEVQEIVDAATQRSTEPTG